ncbi:unannotated protein [freshwater metagenome]|uniref:Unannotated protein n=1 Tax=freshwater metagenome TaxID=449393 RepID=A0A6J6FPR6_9ZZZZ
MHDRRERIDLFALQQNVDLHEIRFLFACRFVIERRVTGGSRLEVVEEIENDFAEGNRVFDFNTVLAEVVHPDQGSAPSLAQLHNRADIILGGQHRRADYGFADRLDFSDGVFRRVGDLNFFTVVGRDVVNNAGSGGNEVKTEFPLKPLGDDFEVKQPEEPTPETEPKRDRRFGFVNERGIAQLEFVERFAQIGEVGAVEWVQTRIDHRFWVGVALQRDFGGLREVRHGIADL